MFKWPLKTKSYECQDSVGALTVPYLYYVKKVKAL